MFGDDGKLVNFESFQYLQFLKHGFKGTVKRDLRGVKSGINQ
jgi:hypothetical protein